MPGAPDAPEQEPEHSGYDRWDQRPVLGTWGLVLAVVIPVLIAAAGFGIVSAISSGTDTATDAVRVPTSDWIPGQPGGTTTITGTLALDDHDCVYLDTPTGQVWPVWPAGFRARLDGSGTVSLYDGRDQLVAREGEGVQAQGASVPASTYAGRPCVPTSGDVAVVRSEVNRVG